MKYRKPADPFAHLAPVVDEIGDLERELDPLKPKAARLDLLRKKIREAYADAPAESEHTLEGSRFAIVVGPRGNQTIIDIPKLLKSVGVKLFARLATVTLKALESECAPDVVETVCSVSRLGSRSLKVLAKGEKGA
jgi:hypothetical protein